jgi:hypothetical protein
MLRSTSAEGLALNALSFQESFPLWINLPRVQGWAAAVTLKQSNHSVPGGNVLRIRAIKVDRVPSTFWFWPYRKRRNDDVPRILAAGAVDLRAFNEKEIFLRIVRAIRNAEAMKARQQEIATPLKLLEASPLQIRYVIGE